MPTTVTTQPQLIAAINFANKVGGAHTITLGADITLLETTPNNSHDGPNGLPEITNHDILTIAGNGHTLQRSTSTQDTDFRLFDVGSGATLTLQDMTVKNGLVATSASIQGGALASSTSVQGGAIFVDGGGKLSLNQVDLTQNAVTQPSELQNGNYFVQGGGIYNAGTANIGSSSIIGNSAEFNLATPVGFGAGGFGTDFQDGLNGNAVVEGGGIYNSGNLTVTSSSVLKNSATSTVINGSNPANGDGNGEFNGDNDSGSNGGNFNGNGVNGNVTVEGGGIYNAGTTTLMGGSLTGNSATSNVTNGSHNGDFNGDNSGNFDGSSNGNGVSGNVTVEGGGIYNAGTTTLMGGSLTGNSATSNVTNGSHNGDFNGDNSGNFDGSSNGNGAFNGNGVLGNITVAGGGIFSHGKLSVTSTGLSGNFGASTIVNGSSNGDGNGDGTEGVSGNDNGNGVDGSILVAGGAIANLNSVTLNQCNVSGNSVTSSITNGSSNGQNDGDSVGAAGEMNNGNGATGSVDVVGGGIHDDGEVIITAGSVSHNSATSSITNGNGNGFTCGNSGSSPDVLADDGDGLAGDLTVEGGGINNDHAGAMSITSATVSDNTTSSSVTNGFANGDACGNSNHSNDNGDAAGNGVTGNLLVGGGAIANNGGLEVSTCTLTANSLQSTISNGNDNGNNDGVFDNGNDSGSNCGNGVGLDGGGIVVRVVGGAIVNAGTTTVTSCSITGNSASSSVTTSAGNGLNDGVESTGANGLGDGDGVNGDGEVGGGGTANLGAAGSLALVSTTPSDNQVSSSPTSGSGDLAADGVVIDGTLSVSGQNTFAPVVHGGESLVNPTAAIGLPPSGPGASMMPDWQQPPSPIQGNQRTLMELPASVYETLGPSAHTAIHSVHTPSHSINADAFFLDPWDELS